MKQVNFVLTLMGLIFLAACGPTGQKKQLLESIAAGEKKIFADSASTIPDQNTGMEMIQAYTDYANQFPDDTASAEFLFKGAEIAMNMKMSGMAIDYYRRIMESWPTYSKVPYCLFLQAFILENDLKQYDQARQRYQEFVDKYPGHVLARDARFSIENMGRPIEELIKEWEMKNKE